MKTGSKVLIIIVVIAVIVIAGYFIFRDDKDKPKPDPNSTEPKPATAFVPGGPTNISGRRASNVIYDNSGGRWIPRGLPYGSGSCPMGQAKIWDGTKYVCCTSDK